MKTRNESVKSQRLYVGVDVGGTKIQAALVRESGQILCREKQSTPRQCGPEAVIETLIRTIDLVLRKGGARVADVSAVGVAIPGVVEPKRGRVSAAPNIDLIGVSLASAIQEKFNVPIAVGNDANFGALGENWLGSARGSKSAFYICVGTGIGAGIVLRGKLWRGERESAGEIGHTIMQIGGPKCGCGNSGCLEALASRTAIERDLREAVAAGRTTHLTELCGGDLSVIRSGMLAKALNENDELAVEVVSKAAQTLGIACLNVRHVVDPEVIVLGGGVIEACGDSIVPIVERIVAEDPLRGARESGRILLSALGDDAVTLGAVAAARTLVGRNPFKKPGKATIFLPTLSLGKNGEVAIDRETYSEDIYIRVDGKVKQRVNADLTRQPTDAISVDAIRLACKGGPEMLFIGERTTGAAKLSDAAARFLSQRAIDVETLPLAKAAESFNKSKARKAFLVVSASK